MPASLAFRGNNIDRRLDQILAGIADLGNRFDDLENGFQAVITAIREHQIPMLKTQIEKLDHLIESVDSEPSGELEEALTSLTRAVNAMHATIMTTQKSRDDCSHSLN